MRYAVMTLSGHLSADPDEVVERIADYVELGFHHLVMHGPGPDQAGVGEIEDRPQVAEAVLDRGAGEIEVGVVPGAVLGGDLAFVGGFVGEHGLADDVADGPHQEREAEDPARDFAPGPGRIDPRRSQGRRERRRHAGVTCPQVTNRRRPRCSKA